MWPTRGPLGAAQRTLGLVTQQLANLYGQGEDLGRQLRTAHVGGWQLGVGR
jgi:hypothetical protein